MDKVEAIASHLADYGLEHHIIVGQIEQDRRSKGELAPIPKVQLHRYPDCLDTSATELSFHRMSGNAPLWVLYSSGTSMSA